jgi:hypothetical protein
MLLYLAPGMEHCFGGDGPYVFDLDTPLAAWVEDNKPPGPILALHFPANAPPTKPDRTRPLCPYPEVAKYKGTGKPRQCDKLRLRQALSLYACGPTSRKTAVNPPLYPYKSSKPIKISGLEAKINRQKAPIDLPGFAKLKTEIEKSSRTALPVTLYF